MVSMEQQEQHSSVGVEELTKVRMRWSCQALAKQRLVPLKLRGTSRTPMIVHVRFMAVLLRPNAKAHLPGPVQELVVARNRNSAPVRWSAWFGGS